jgi:hypothetical protein
MKLRLNLSAIAFAIFTSAAASAELPAQDADDAVLVARAHAAVDAYLQLWGAYPASGVMQAFDEDAVLEYAHSIPRLHAQVTGRQSMITQVQAVAQLGEDWTFTQPKLYPTLSPNVYYARYVASARLKATGERFERNVIIRVEMGSEKASRLVEFANPAIAGSAGTIRKTSSIAVPDGAAAHVAPLDVCSDNPS